LSFLATPVNCFQWFEEKQQEIETLDAQLKKLYSSVENLVGNRKGNVLKVYTVNEFLAV